MALSVTIKKKLGNFQLDISFEAGNEILALLGASGCGKSMTLKCIAGIVTPDEGSIVLDGRVLFDSQKKINLPPQKRRVGYLFQNYALFPNMTVWQNIAAGVRGGKDRREQVVSEKIKALYLEGLQQKYPHQLSGGQQQRVALARILANEPEMIMLDEPFSALDSYLKWQLEQELSDTLSSYSGTTLFVSHNRDEVYRICQRVLLIDAGKSEPAVSVSALFRRPATLSGALLTGCKNYSRIRPLEDGRVEALDWGETLRCAAPLSDEIRYIGVRAHYIVPEKIRQPDPPGPEEAMPQPAQPGQEEKAMPQQAQPGPEEKAMSQQAQPGQEEKAIPQPAGPEPDRPLIPRPENGAEEDNLIICRVLRVTQDVFSIIYMLRGVHSPGDSDFCDIRMELPKDHDTPYQVGETIAIRFKPCDILLLK